MRGIEPWEPEETVGRIWHRFASRLDAPAAHAGAAMALAPLAPRLGVLFRALGGGKAVAIKPVADEASGHRLSWRRGLAVAEERVPRGSFDGETLRLPAEIALFPDRDANAVLYLWLTLSAAVAHGPVTEEDPLRADLRAIAAARATARLVAAECPGLADLGPELGRACLALRRPRARPRQEAAIEAVVARALVAETPLPADAARLWQAVETGELGGLAAPRGYRRFEPVPIWLERRPLARSEGHTDDDPDAAEGGRSQRVAGTRRARRRKAEQAERRDSLILHKFEAILSWTEFLNLNRRVEDDDPDSARKALDDQDEIGLGQISKAPATRFKLDLDLAPEDVDRERLSGAHLYPEWDARQGAYLPAHVRVLRSLAEARAELVPSDPAAARRARQVRRQFEALRPRRMPLAGQIDGEELDLDAALRAEADRAACGACSDRVWRASRPEARDLAVSILLDVSRSTESAVAGRAIIDIEREALTALAWGLQTCGDAFAIHAFSSLRRDRVFVQRCKGFDEPMSAGVAARIAGLRPGFYTRLGAAVRHVSSGLARRPTRRRLLLVVTDGKPNDLDHYEGRHGIEDTRMAVREARMAGQAVHGVLIDSAGKAWFPRIFGRGGFSVVPHPDRLCVALPAIYRQLVGA